MTSSDSLGNYPVTPWAAAVLDSLSNFRGVIATCQVLRCVFMRDLYIFLANCRRRGVAPARVGA